MHVPDMSYPHFVKEKNTVTSIKIKVIIKKYQRLLGDHTMIKEKVGKHVMPSKKIDWDHIYMVFLPIKY